MGCPIARKIDDCTDCIRDSPIQRRRGGIVWQTFWKHLIGFIPKHSIRTSIRYQKYEPLRLYVFQCTLRLPKKPRGRPDKHEDKWCLLYRCLNSTLPFVHLKSHLAPPQRLIVSIGDGR